MNNKPPKSSMFKIPRNHLALIASLGLSLLAPLSAHADRQDQAIECNFKGCTSDEVVVVAPIIAGSGGDPGSIVAPPNTPPTPNPTPNPSGNHGNTHPGGGGGGIKGDNSNPSPVTPINPNHQTAAEKQATAEEKARAACPNILVALPRGQYKCYVKPLGHCSQTLFKAGGQPYSTGCSGSPSTIDWLQGTGCKGWYSTDNTCADDLSSK